MTIPYGESQNGDRIKVDRGEGLGKRWELRVNEDLDMLEGENGEEMAIGRKNVGTDSGSDHRV